MEPSATEMSDSWPSMLTKLACALDVEPAELLGETEG